MSKKPFVVYTHIEKCAGTTMNFILGNNFPFMVYPWPLGFTNDHRTSFNENFVKRLLDKFSFVQGISGHNIRPYTEYETVVNGRPVFRYTFLRDPIKRYVSMLNFYRTDMNMNMSVEEFLENKRLYNFQCGKIYPDADANKAISVIENKMDLVGITEYFDKSIVLLNDALAINPYYIRRNVMGAKSKVNYQPIPWKSFTPEQQKKAIENNIEDQKLYNHCLEKFKAKYQEVTGHDADEEYIPELKQEKSSIKFYQSIVVKKIYRKFIEPRSFSDYLATREKA